MVKGHLSLVPIGRQVVLNASCELLIVLFVTPLLERHEVMIHNKHLLNRVLGSLPQFFHVDDFIVDVAVQIFVQYKLANFAWRLFLVLVQRCVFILKLFVFIIELVDFTHLEIINLEYIQL